MNSVKKTSLFSYTAAMAFIFTFSIFSSGMLWSDNAEAHKGHAGKKITFVKNKVALKALLPTDGKTYRRKQRLSSEQKDWATATYNVELGSKVFAYYISKDKKTKHVIGSAMIHKFTYRHGNAEVAVGLDNNGKVTSVAFVSINEKYLVDFEETVGQGFLKKYDGMSLDDLVKNAKESESADKATREFANALRDAAITLTAFQKIK